MNKELLKELNEQQGKIIHSIDKKIIVSAGPGSGKTYTIVKKLNKNF